MYVNHGSGMIFFKYSTNSVQFCFMVCIHGQTTSQEGLRVDESWVKSYQFDTEQHTNQVKEEETDKVSVINENRQNSTVFKMTNVEQYGMCGWLRQHNPSKH